MKRIERTFADLRRAGKKGFIPFVTAGDPDIDTSLSIIKCLADCGASIIELGVPFSDPMADGPTIQRSSQRALAGGTNISSILDLVSCFREFSDVPIVLFSYLNPLMRFGFAELCTESRRVGIDGILITDVTGLEARQIGLQLSASSIDMISLIAPTTTDVRIKEIAHSAAGFIYAVSRAGVTGAQTETSVAAKILVGRARQCTSLPIAVGFGISTARQIQDVWEYADAAVVGSAIVSTIEQADSRAAALDDVRGFVSSLMPENCKSFVGSLKLRPDQGR